MSLPAGGFTLNVGNPWFSWHYVTSNWATIKSAAGEHIILTLLAVGIGFAIALPVSVLARGSGWGRGVVLSTSSALYAIPSLAAIAALYPIFGFSSWTVVIPLAAYSLVILVRNIMAGLDGVPSEVLDAAKGMGLSRRRTFWKVSMPLASPTIIAGLRLATVSTIELVVIGGFVGTGGFGEYITEGFQNNFYKAEITTYVLATVLLALTADLIWLGIQWLLTPWTRRGA